MTTDEALACARAAILSTLEGWPHGAVLGHFMHTSGLRDRTDDGLSMSRVFDRALKKLKKERVIEHSRSRAVWIKKVELP